MYSKMSCRKSFKILRFLKKLKERKGVLFGKFSDILQRKDKQDAWEELRVYCISIGLVTSDKDFKFVRDNTWGANLRKKTMKKIDVSKTTGAEGGPDPKLDEVDRLVIDIIGIDSPVIDGLGVADSLTAGISTTDEQLEDEEPENLEEGQQDIHTQKRLMTVWEKDSQVSQPNRKRVAPKTFIQNLEELKKTKLEIEIQNLKLEQIKLKLQIENLKMDLFTKEQDHNMVLSKVTIPLARRVKSLDLVID